MFILICLFALTYPIGTSFVVAFCHHHSHVVTTERCKKILQVAGEKGVWATNKINHPPLSTLIPPLSVDRKNLLYFRQSKTTLYQENNSIITKEGDQRKITKNKVFNVVKMAIFAISIFLFGYNRAVYDETTKAASTAIMNTAVKHAASSTTTAAVSSSSQKFTGRFPILSTMVSVLLAREVWRLIPVWIKSRIQIIRRLKQRGLSPDERIQQRIKTDPDDMCNLGTIAMKLQNLYKLAQSKVDNTIEESGDTKSNSFDVLGPLLASLQLYRQYDDRLPANEQYELFKSSGRMGTAKDLTGLDEAFEWADLAYDENPLGSLKEILKSQNFSLLKHDTPNLPGYVGHYIAMNKERRLVVIGVKGTSTFEDMLTDCCGLAVSHKLDGPFVINNNNKNRNNSKRSSDSNDEDTSSNIIRCHEGILISSKRLADDLQAFVEELLLPSGYKILVVGHSLGAAAASMLALILRSRIKSLTMDANGELLKVIAFASPPILDYKNAISCSSFITTIVNNNDVITRGSLANLIVSLELLKQTNAILKQNGMDTSSRKSTAKLIRKLSEKIEDTDLLIEPDAYRQMVDLALNTVQLDDPDHLYVPGQTIIMYDKLSLKDRQQQQQKETIEVADNSGNGHDETVTSSSIESNMNEERGVVLSEDGTAKVLRLIALESNMLTDHLSPAYRASLRTLLSKP